MKPQVAYIYDIYPQDYQSYINLVMDEIKNTPNLNSTIYAFNARTNNVISLKYNLFRKAKNKIINLFKSRGKSLYIKELDKGNFDIIHIQHSYLFAKFFDAFKNSNSKTKFIITLRGGDTYIKPWLAEKWRMFYNEFGRSLFFVTMSEHQKNYLKKWGVPDEQVFVIPISHNNRVKIDIANRIKDNNRLRIASVFRMTWEKNIQGNLLFIKKLIDKGVEVQYDVYGDGNDLGEAYYLVDRFHLHDYVNIVGKVSYLELMEKLKQYHFILQLSVSEALPSSILEAQSFSIPAIISDSDGLPEAIMPGASAICYPFWEINKLVDDTINLWEDKEKYIAFCEKSFENSQRFTTDKEIEQLIKMYHKVLKGIS